MCVCSCEATTRSHTHARRTSNSHKEADAHRAAITDSNKSHAGRRVVVIVPIIDACSARRGVDSDDESTSKNTPSDHARLTGRPGHRAPPGKQEEASPRATSLAYRRQRPRPSCLGMSQEMVQYASMPAISVDRTSSDGQPRISLTRLVGRFLFALAAVVQSATRRRVSVLIIRLQPSSHKRR